LPNVKFFFNHKLLGADFKHNLAWFEQRASSSNTPSTSNHITEVERSFDFMIGADGAHSAVRYHLMKFTRMSYSQSYINTLWCEFHISPAVSPGVLSAWRTSPNHLHIWPGGSFMFIAVPSLDHTFTSTLFLSAEQFAYLDVNPKERLVPFFQHNFPGVVPQLINESDLLLQYTTNPHLPLISIDCSPYHHSSSGVIVGDAAHAMVPFYGQGMNAGLESVRVLFSHLDAHPSDRAAALAAYTAERAPDAKAICDMALANYAEMAAHVTSPVYIARKWVEEHLDKWLPTLGWATQYSRVSFGNERYSEVVASARKQKVVLRSVVALGLALVGGTAYVFRSRRFR
jgi:kynurenine 3-monooxygenase